jgi:hypothetical protein
MDDYDPRVVEPNSWRFSGKSLRRKGTFYTDFETGLFGNKARTWNSYGELVASGWKDLVCIRGKGIPREDVKYNLPFEQVRKEVEGLIAKGYPEYLLKFNQSMPDYALSIQGEVVGITSRDTHMNGLELTYTTVKKPMNEGLKEETKFASGLFAKLILCSRMDPSSFEDLQALFEIYPDSAVEFSTYEVAVGDIPNRNTVFWEVRNY